MAQTETSGSITATELAVFCRQVGAMLSAGVDILRAIQIGADQSPSQRLKSVAYQIRVDLENGRLMAAALSRYPDLFSPFFVSMVRQGEREGVLAQVMASMADYLDRERVGLPGQAVAPAMGFDVGEIVEKLKPLVFWQMLTLGVIALGIAGLWWASLYGLLPADVFGPNIALWVGSCILVSALIFRSFRPPRIAHCSFCSRPESVTGVLVQGPGVAICQACLRSNVEQMKSAARQEEEAGALQTAEEELEARGSQPAVLEEIPPQNRPPLHTGNGSAPVDHDEPSGEGEVKRIEI